MDLEDSFELHTWMIARLVETSGSNKSHISHYVIAACYQRMLTRINYCVSVSFRNALKDLSSKSKVPERFPPTMTTGVDTNDNYFITFLSKVHTTLNLKTPIDNLAKQKIELYNQETYAVFHMLLSELLDLFLNFLVKLKDMHHQLRGKISLSQLEAARRLIDDIATVGTLLRLLVKGRVIKRCLYSIVGLLPAARPKVEKETDGDDDEWARDDEEDGLYRGDEEEANELEGVGNAYLELEPKSQACLRSLNLGVIYFDAIMVLSRFVKKQNSNDIPVTVNININVLRLPHPNEGNRGNRVRMLPWKTLLRHETYFPGKPSPSAEEIVEFLELLASSTGNENQKSNKFSLSTVVSPKSVRQSVAKLRRHKHDLNNDTITTEIDQAIESLKKIRDTATQTPGLTKYIQNIIAKLELAKDLYPAKALDINDEIDEIVEMLKTLADNTKLKKMLQKGLALDTGVGFKGSVHAEACIAAHCTFTEPQWFPPVSYFIIMFCSDLLILLVVFYSTSSRRI